jgi:hypothetical protein
MVKFHLLVSRMRSFSAPRNPDPTFFYAGSGCGSARSPDLDVGKVAVGDELVADEAQLDLAAQAVQQQHRLTLKGQRLEIGFFLPIFHPP